MVKVSGLHLLLTYECNLECSHCFVFGSPCQSGTMTFETIGEILRQAKETGTVEWIYFEGGEPFLYYGILKKGVDLAAEAGFLVGIVSNGYWATDIDDAVTCLEPFTGRVQDLSISSDAYHWDEKLHRQAANAVAAAERLSIPVETISIAQPEATHTATATGQLPPGESGVVFRGRAVEKLASRADLHDRASFTECPFEDLRAPERVHLDPFGHVHICQGISMGNFLERPLREIFAGYDPEAHPVTGPLLKGGPAELARHHGITCNEAYADACHLCYETRLKLRDRLPDVLAPDQMYGEFDFD